MLEDIFGSKTRVKLLRLFLNNPQQPYYLRELARMLKSQLNSVRREVENLQDIGIIKAVEIVEPEGESEEEEEVKPQKGKKKAKAKKTKKGQKTGIKKYFLADTEFILYPELKALLLKAQVLLERSFVTKIEKMPEVDFFLLTGAFLGMEQSLTDILLVGSINQKKLAAIVRNFERELNRSINYTVLTYPEYKYRHDITDRFLYDILESKKIVIIDRLPRA